MDVATCVHTELQTNQTYDPTHTLTLRNMFARKFARKMQNLRGVLRTTIVERDCFGLSSVETNEMQSASREQFAYENDTEKMGTFMEWFRRLFRDEIVSVNTIKNAKSAWMSTYIYEAYRRGIERAINEMRKRGMDIPDIEALGGVEVVLEHPVHKQKIQDAYVKTLNDLERIESDTLNRMQRILIDSFERGESPQTIAQKINMGLLSGRDKLALIPIIGRFVAMERRMDMLARTSIVRAINEAALAEYERWGITEVGPEAELIWVSAEDSKVCAYCRTMAAKSPYSIHDAVGLLPAHSRCRCFWQPVT